MVGQMGGAMANLNQPQAAPVAAAMPPPLPAVSAYHVAIGGAQTGPFEMSALQAQISGGQLKRDTLVWRAGMAAWTKAGDVAEVAGLFAAVPPPLPPG